MVDQFAGSLSALLTQEQVWIVIGAFALAYGIHLLARRLARRMIRIQRFAPWQPTTSHERQTTLTSLIAGLISFIALTTALLVSLGVFIGLTNLVWIVGLFSAAFGLGARPIVSDFLSGISFIFDDTFDVGEKVEIPALGQLVEGIIEAVNLRTTIIRATTGEVFTVPNGEIRLVRNYSRGMFSRADISLEIPAEYLVDAIALLESLADEAVTLLPNLLEPWQVISESGQIGQKTELTLVTKARFGYAADMRPRLLALVQERMNEAGINTD